MIEACKKCNIVLYKNNSFEVDDPNYEYCKSCVNYVKNLQYAISTIDIWKHNFFLDKFLKEKSINSLRINQIVDLFYKIKRVRDNSYSPVSDPEKFTLETHPKYYKLKRKGKYEKLYKNYPYEYISDVLFDLGTAIENGDPYAEKPKVLKHCFLHIDEEIIDIDNRKSLNTKYRVCGANNCSRFLNSADKVLCYLCSD